MDFLELDDSPELLPDQALLYQALVCVIPELG